MRRPVPIRALPPGYHEARRLGLFTSWQALRLNLLALLPLAAALAGMAGWSALAQRLRGPLPGGPDVPWWLVFVLLLVLPLHEWIHGLGMRWAGHRPRYGLLLHKGALYATADGALFPRRVFLIIALAPLAVITLAGMALVIVLPDRLGYYAALAVALNAGASVGDLWMAAAVWPCPPAALVRDEADGIRIYLPSAD